MKYFMRPGCPDRVGGRDPRRPRQRQGSSDCTARLGDVKLDIIGVQLIDYTSGRRSMVSHDWRGEDAA
eukprot:8288948-Pyramimonas_sp.AAC.2